MADVFLSYAREDQSRARVIADALSHRGWTVWWDRKTPPGLSFDEVIERELSICHCAIVLWSANSVKSRWVLTEANDAAERNILVPVRIEDVKVPFEFRRLHAADLTEWDGARDDDQWNQIVDRVSELVAPSKEPVAEVPPIAALEALSPSSSDEAPRHPRSGILSEAEIRVVDTVVLTKAPLILVGEPGSGKTHLAETIADRLGLEPPSVFETRSDSTAVELLYQYDGIRRQHDAQRRGAVPPFDPYLTLGPLGLAIVLSGSTSAPPGLRFPQSANPRRSVVLIEGVDKGSREFANDLTGSLRTMSFVVKEAGNSRVTANRDRWPIVVMTSTGERELPDALLRICVYHQMAFPAVDHLEAIARALNPGVSERMVSEAARRFCEIRALPDLRNLPGLSQFLVWLKVIVGRSEETGASQLDGPDAMALDASLLAKSYEDRLLLEQHLKPAK